MLRLKQKSHEDAKAMARWLSENVAVGDYAKPTHVSTIARTLYYLSKDKTTWEIKWFGISNSVAITGIPKDLELIFCLRFS